MRWMKLSAVVILVLGLFVRPGEVTAAPIRVCSVTSTPCSSHPCASCAATVWDTADIDPANGVQTRPAYLGIIRQRVNQDGNAGRVGAVMWARVIAACNKHTSDKNRDSTQGNNNGRCNSLLITEAAQCSGPADNDNGWLTVAEKLEQGH